MNIKVELMVISKITNKNISFMCDSYDCWADGCFEGTYTFNFGPVGCRWSHRIRRSLVKSITKI